jgi:hypothetical protein
VAQGRLESEKPRPESERLELPKAALRVKGEERGGAAGVVQVLHLCGSEQG